ncbi:hypothetical protein FRACYDRAFT_266453 [Fragilariopsis cylindrus CCMP1102]|uniref:Peptidase M14 carboxypeptidase A domain-containing protein n=1 Tax=Fragilariopsis cylindrus CCMP1102 TaxID=635003 RepID=A0A1E7EJI8_9STRA|nr:hypothetical protein FRACYDRAFT_266453 [Fragilariopsis cylindrus CCMP1102]|eukprot:OEU06066.1 hypothetical protein FRACYDRAFT_266453 [Fragilariopsis cylindrus CCMP1102]
MMKFLFQITLVVVAILIYRFYGRYYDSVICANNGGGGDPSIRLNLKFQYPVNNENNYIDNSIVNIEFNDNNDDDSTGTGEIESDYYNSTTEFYEYKYQYEYKDPCKLFSSEYMEARTKFGIAVNLYKNKKNDEDDDDDDDDNTVELLSFPVTGGLTIDVAILYGNTKELGTIIHSSGVHGVEGYAGSAIQLAILELLTASNKAQQRIERRPTVILMHAINPVGMKEYRRCNENNVDLNRNNIIIHKDNDNDNNNDDDNDRDRDTNNNEHYTSFKDFVSRRDPNIAGYDDFRHLFVPEDNDDNNDSSTSAEGLSLYDTTIGYYRKTIPAIWKYGLIAIKRAMVAGQYHDQGGLNYGGQEQQKSIQHIVDFLFNNNDRKELLNNSQSVIWIDVHTGLGPFGKDSIDYHRVDEEDEYEKRRQVLRLEPKDYFSSIAYSVTTTTTTTNYLNSAKSESESESNSADAFKGYDLTKGMLMEYIADSYRRKTLNNSSSSSSGSCSRSGIFMIQEFGTLPTVLVGRALILDNMLYQKHLNNNKNPQNQARNNHNRDNEELLFDYRSPFLKYAFYPQSIEWRKSIIQRGVSLFLESIEYSKANSRVLLKGKQKGE